MMDLVNAKANTIAQEGRPPVMTMWGASRIWSRLKIAVQYALASKEQKKESYDSSLTLLCSSALVAAWFSPGCCVHAGGANQGLGQDSCEVGRIKDMDKIAVKYALASKEQRVQLRTQMSNTIDFLDAKKDPCVPVDHFTPLAPAKIDQFTVRKHILTAFLEFDEEEVAIS
ncbi:unnamed protein product [Closterium sp. NIES-65]|nr:unnamed protein product [Closterium sp. NIES-65]